MKERSEKPGITPGRDPKKSDFSKRRQQKTEDKPDSSRRSHYDHKPGDHKPAFIKKKRYDGKPEGKYDKPATPKSDSYGRDRRKKASTEKDFTRDRKPGIRKKENVREKPEVRSLETETRPSKGVRLNKFIANAGICSRREADKLIESGVVSINGQVVTTLGVRVFPGDEVRYGGQLLKGEKLVYILLNKPKGYITSTDDPASRKTVMHLVQNACRERVYPVGRLDRNSTGLLLLTNDGLMAKKLTHPSHGVIKVYHVELDRNLSKTDMEAVAAGIELDDGTVRADEISYAGSGLSKKEVGIVIHSGKNRVIRRVFEKLGYEVMKLDRTMFANLTKKDLPRGKWRFLTPEEVNILKRIR